MEAFLRAVAEYGVYAREHLLAEGYHWKVINAKALKASRKGYYDFGVVADRGWLTAKGKEMLDKEASGG
jgi:hypothetical protein